ncbi:hypothetical protein FFJ24_005580 [Pedobacter sp. KBS0701]|uniref:hypothetical protein n=1 Tax=Pedobacter sp. KBS0701 TaxID=2578106 RepID=UPI00110E5C0E|nr:hypothetical protein [Pedobacter sp. KBS0701]QDW24321.1 hypothetical protein FFJ24_005580 [Pedobacter sp. KBS0701]
MKKFKSKGFQNFESAHFDLNIFIKFSIAAVDHLSDNNRSKEELTSFVAHLLNNAGERWGLSRYDEPFEKLTMVRSRITKSGIMWVYSAFEVYVNYAHSYCANSVEVSANTKPEILEDKVKIEVLFGKYSWNINQLDYLMPLLKFYTEARHCIVHNMGKANNTMLNILSSNEFKTAVENWPTVLAGRKLSAPTLILSDGKIVFNPHHAITYSDICWRIARIIDENIFTTLNIDHFLLETASSRLDKSNILGTIERKNIYSYLRNCLNQDLNISLKDEEIKEILETKFVLDELKIKFNTMKTFLKKTEIETQAADKKSRKKSHHR